MINREAAAVWLNDYIAAWKAYDADAIGALFSEDVQYYFSPYSEVVVGRDAVVKAWLEDPDDAGTYDGHYAPIAVDDDVVVANGRSVYYAPGSKAVGAEFDNIFVMRFNDAGQCREFREWYMKKS